MPCRLIKNNDLVNVIIGIFYMYTDVPISIYSSPDKFHKVITWLKMFHSMKSISLRDQRNLLEKEKEEDAGTLFEQELRFMFPGNDDDTSSLLDQVRGRPLLIKDSFF